MHKVVVFTFAVFLRVRLYLEILIQIIAFELHSECYEKEQITSRLRSKKKLQIAFRVKIAHNIVVFTFSVFSVFLYSIIVFLKCDCNLLERISAASIALHIDFRINYLKSQKSLVVFHTVPVFV